MKKLLLILLLTTCVFSQKKQRVGEVGDTLEVSEQKVTGTAIFDGNVGIGTTNPTSKLHVLGTTKTGRLVDSLTIDMFGAVGNNSTVNTTAIQAAVNAGYDAIYIPEGIYLTDRITISSPIKIYGEGTIKAINNLTSQVFLVNSGNVIFDGITIDGNRSGQGSNKTCILVNNASDSVSIKDVTIKNVYGYGILLSTGSVKNLEVDRCKFNSISVVGVGVQCELEVGKINNNTFINTGVHAIQFYGVGTDTCRSVDISNNYCKGNTAAPIEVNIIRAFNFTINSNILDGGTNGISLGFLYDSIIDGNSVRLQTNEAFELGYSYNVIMSDNIADSCSQGFLLYGNRNCKYDNNLIKKSSSVTTTNAAFNVQANSYCTFTNNTINDPIGSAFRIVALAGDTCRYNVFDNNKILFDANRLSNPSAFAMNSLQYSQVKNNDIIVRSIYTPTNYAGTLFIIGRCYDVRINNNNVVFDSLAAKSAMRALYIDSGASAEKLRITNNYFANWNVTIATYQYSGSDVIASGNRVENTALEYYMHANHKVESRMTSNGTFAFGTGGAYTPTSKLHVYDVNKTITQDGMLTVASTDNQAINYGGSITFGGSYTDVGTQISWASIAGRKESGVTGESAGYMTLNTRPVGGAITERMRITSTGLVGIGTTNPAVKLQVTGGAKSDSLSVGAGGIYIRNCYYNAADSSLNFIFYNNALARIDTVKMRQKG